MPLHADIQVRARALGLDVLTPILWHKIANGATESKGNGAYTQPSVRTFDFLNLPARVSYGKGCAERLIN
jgi:hypothetical protein